MVGTKGARGPPGPPGKCGCSSIGGPPFDDFSSKENYPKVPVVRLSLHLVILKGWLKLFVKMSKFT